MVTASVEPGGIVDGPIIEEVTTTASRLPPLWLFLAFGLGLGYALTFALKRA